MVTLAGANDDSGAAFTTGNALPYDRELDPTDIPSMSAHGAGAGPGGGAGPYSRDDSGSAPALDLALEAVRSSRIMAAACVASWWKTRKATALNWKESRPLPTRAPLKPRTNQSSHPPRCPAPRPRSRRTPALSPFALRPSQLTIQRFNDLTINGPTPWSRF